MQANPTLYLRRNNCANLNQLPRFILEKALLYKRNMIANRHKRQVNVCINLFRNYILKLYCQPYSVEISIYYLKAHKYRHFRSSEVYIASLGTKGGKRRLCFSHTLFSDTTNRTTTFSEPFYRDLL